MDRLAALADILPPQPPAPLPPLPWWQMPWAGWALAAALLFVAWGVLAWRRTRVWTRLQRQAHAVRTDSAATAESAATASAATQLAAALREQWPESDWPQTMRTPLDDLRFAPRPDAARLRLIALGVERASARAARAAWWSPARAQRRFVQTLRAAALEAP
ncbi:hypothetical protein [Thiomonas intermedia]|uniref:hypothetical protein n=1 Tax=Thiomonas intermedia TaxID=926 RepID=UPI0009A4B320|nr:hypothetical protein [Thiomonas intermedia]